MASNVVLKQEETAEATESAWFFSCWKYCRQQRQEHNSLLS